MKKSLNILHRTAIAVFAVALSFVSAFIYWVPLHSLLNKGKDGIVTTVILLAGAAYITRSYPKAYRCTFHSDEKDLTLIAPGVIYTYPIIPMLCVHQCIYISTGTAGGADMHPYMLQLSLAIAGVLTLCALVFYVVCSVKYALHGGRKT